MLSDLLFYIFALKQKPGYRVSWSIGDELTSELSRRMTAYVLVFTGHKEKNKQSKNIQPKLVKSWIFPFPHPPKKNYKQ